MTSKRTRVEITKEELTELLKQYPQVRFDGLRYTIDVKMNGGTWNKPVACEFEGKYFRIDDRNP